MLPGVQVRVIMGEAFGETSPVTTYSRTLYLDCVMEAGAEFALPEDEVEMALYVVEGEVTVGNDTIGAGVMAVLRPGMNVTIKTARAVRIMVIGGDALGARKIWWNFVHSDPQRIEQARDDWREGRFEPVPGDDEFIPLPDSH